MLPAADILENLATRLDRLPDAAREELRRLVEDAAEQLLGINRGYLAAGYAADGLPLQPNTYSPAYAKFKAKYGKNKQVVHVDLNLSEEFYQSFDLLPLGELRFQIVATDAKYGFLSKYGELLGIRESDLDDFVQNILKPQLQEFITSYLRAV